MGITPEMEIVRERVLSLIPKKKDGKFAHGALKEFANSIGLKSGNLISDWINLRSHSYMNYLYEIAAKYNVSVEWLKGETDIKNPASETETGKVPTIQDWKDFLSTFSKEELKAVIDMATTELLRRD